jgi:hypothetical protein
VQNRSKFLEEAKNRRVWALDINREQRRREREDLEFQDAERQWSQQERAEREGQWVTVGGGRFPLPARPTLSISKIEQPISLVLNQQRNALLGVNIHPISPDADDDRAKIYQGLYRQIERDSRAGIARSWAFSRSVWAGRGYYRIGTKWADEVGGDPFDQVISIDRILHQDSVTFDPAAQEPDFSDARFAFIDSWVPYKDFKRQYPKSKLSDDGDGLRSDGVFQEPEWVEAGDGSGEPGPVCVAEYFYREIEKERIGLTDEGQVVRIKSDTEVETIDGEPLTGAVTIVRERERDVIKVKWAKITGAEVLEEADWAGKYIPIVTVLGRELIPFDRQRRWQGMVRPARDAQRTYNYAASTLVERAALEPKAPYVGDPRQFQGYEDWWAQSNTRNFPYLPANLTVETDAGIQVLQAPQRTRVDTSTMGPAMLLLQQSDGFIQSSTFTPDPNLGNYDSTERSGKAIERLQQQSEQGNSDYLHQLATISMTYEAMVVLDLMPHIYDRPGRIVRTRDEEEKTDTVMLNQKFIRDPRTNQPVPFMEGQQPPPMRPPKPGEPPPTPPEPKEYDMRKGIYGVAVTIGRSFQTRMQHAQVMLGRAMEAMPEAVPIIAPYLFKNSDFPEAERLAEDFLKLRDEKYPSLAQDDGDEQTPAQAMAQVAAQKQQIQQLQQQLEEMGKKQEIDFGKQQATFAKAKLDTEARVQIEQMKAENDRVLAELDAQTKLLVALIEQKGVAEEVMLKHAATLDQKEADFELGQITSPQADGMEE